MLVVEHALLERSVLADLDLDLETDPLQLRSGDGRDVEDEARGIVRPDTILIMRLDPATGTVSVLSLPRAWLCRPSQTANMS